MSSELKALFKVNLKQSFDVRRKNNKKNSSSLLALLLIILVVGCLFSGIYGYIFYILAADLAIDFKYIIYAMAGLASLICLATSIPRVKNTLFGSKDYDLLASMPIKKSHIILVKFISIYLMELLYSCIFVLPSTLIIVFLGKDYLILLDGLLLIFVLPVIPLLVAGIIGLFIGLIADRFKFGNLISLILYLGVLGLIMYSSYFGNSSNATTADMQSFFDIYSWFNPSTKLLSLPLGLNYLIYVGINLIILVLIILVFAKGYDYFHFLMTSTKSTRKYVQKSVKVKGQFKAILSLDLKRYFASKTYLMNTITGGVLAVLMIIIMINTFASVDSPEAEGILKLASPYFSILILWLVGLTVPSAVAINFDGKYFWLMKNLPISYKDYGKSKIILSEIVLAPFVLVASSVLLFFIELNFLNVFMVFVLPQIYLFSMNLIGYYINTKVYKLEWSNEIEAVKNSKSMVLAMLVDFGYTIAITAIFICLGIFVNFWIGAVCAISLCLIVLIVMLLLCRKHCSRRIAAIEV